LSHEKVESHILVTAAVDGEAAGIRDRMISLNRKDIGGRPVYEGRIGAVPVRLVVTGPGMVNTAQSLTAAIEARPPAVILMTGCAGGFERAGVDVGDIGIATEENDAHLGIEPEVAGQAPAPLPFDLETIGGVSVGQRIPVDRHLANNAATLLKDGFRDSGINVVQGAFVTVSTVTATERGAGRLYDRLQPCMETMEGAAAAHVAMHYGIPFLEIRCASNRVGKRDRGAWDLPLACRRSADAAVMWVINQ